MDAVRGVASVSGLAALGLVIALAISSVSPPAASGASAILAPETQGTLRGDFVGPGSREATGSPLQVEAVDGPAPQAAWGFWDGGPVVVLKLDAEALRGASAVHGRNLGQYAVAHPFEDSVALVAYSGRSTFLGCTLSWATHLGGSKAVPDYDEDGRADGRLFDVCHQGQWDAYAMGTNQPHGPAPEPLDVVRLQLRVTSGEASLWGVERIPQGSAFDADRQGPGAPFRLGG